MRNEEEIKGNHKSPSMVNPFFAFFIHFQGIVFFEIRTKLRNNYLFIHKKLKND